MIRLYSPKWLAYALTISLSWLIAPNMFAQVSLFDDAVSIGTIFHSNGSEPANPMVDNLNHSSLVINNSGAGAWERTELFPDTYTIQANDKLFISFYNPNGAASWQLKMSLSTSGADFYIGDFGHNVNAAGGWHETVIDLSAYTAEELTKITIYPTGGEALSIFYDQLYIDTKSSLGFTYLFNEVTSFGLWNSAGAIVSNPVSDAINYSGMAISNNGSNGWEETQWFPDYVIQPGDQFHISFYNPNGAVGWQLRMDLSTAGSFTFIGEPGHDANAATGWVEATLSLDAYATESISKIQLYPAAGEAKQVYYDNVYFSSSSQLSNYWTGSSSTNWMTTANWQGDYLPSALSNVTILDSSNPPVISDNIEIGGLILSDDLRVTSGTLTVNGDVDGISGSLLVSSGASLITMGSISGTSHQISRNTTFNVSTGQYSAVGSPVSAASTSVLGSLVYQYDEDIDYDNGSGNGSARFIKITTPETMLPGDAYFSGFTGMIDFIGTPNTGNIDLGLVYDDINDGANAGFNLVSNPYPCAINYESFVDNNTDISGTIYLWDDGGSNTGQRTNSDYVTVNLIGSIGDGSAATGGPNNDGGGSRWDNHLLAGQGFFVKATSAGTLHFNNDMKAAGSNSDGNFFRVEGLEEQRMIQSMKLTLSNAENTIGNETLLGFLEDATMGYDRLYDAFKIDGNQGIKLFTKIDDMPLAIQGLPLVEEEMIIPLLMSLGQPEDYKLNLQSLNNWPDDRYVYLQDNKLGIEIALDQNSQYQFHSEAVESNARFSLAIRSSKLLAIEDNVTMTVQYNRNELILSDSKSNSGPTSVQILDLSGKVLLKRELETVGTRSILNFDFEANKLYIIKVATKDKVIVSKIAFN
ncbi:MAG: hypothetical protein ACI8TA_001057 [Cyclobacteriaceae bacterium]|jgi:hypothetical protein